MFKLSKAKWYNTLGRKYKRLLISPSINDEGFVHSQVFHATSQVPQQVEEIPAFWKYTQTSTSASQSRIMKNLVQQQRHQEDAASKYEDQRQKCTHHRANQEEHTFTFSSICSLHTTQTNAQKTDKKKLGTRVNEIQSWCFPRLEIALNE